MIRRWAGLCSKDRERHGFRSGSDSVLEVGLPPVHGEQWEVCFWLKSFVDTVRSVVLNIGG